MEKEKYEREGARLKEALKYMRDHVDAHYSQRTLAADLHYTEQTISHYASGKHRMSDDDYQRLADLWGMRVEYLRGDDDFMTVDEMYKAAEVERTEYTNAHLKYLEVLGYSVKEQLTLDCYGVDEFEEMWPQIKLTLTDEALNTPYRYGPDGYRTLAGWDGKKYHIDAFAIQGLPVKAMLDGYKLDDSTLNLKFTRGLHYSLSYIIRQNDMPIATIPHSGMLKLFQTIDEYANLTIALGIKNWPYQDFYKSRMDWIEKDPWTKQFMKQEKDSQN